MDTRELRMAELIGFMAVFALFYFAVLGPVLGAVLSGFDTPVMAEDDDVGHALHRGELPDTARGWLLVVLSVPALLGYMYLRARLSGQSMDDFWNPPYAE